MQNGEDFNEKKHFLIDTTSNAQGTQALHCARQNVDSNCRGPSVLQLKRKIQLANEVSLRISKYGYFGMRSDENF
jgi:hypothetical protein